MEQTKKSSKVGLIAAIALLVVSIGLLFIMVAVGPLADNGAGFGLLAGIGQYFAAFITDPGLTGTGKVWFAANQSFGGFIGVGLTFLALILLVIEIILLVRKNEKGRILHAIILFVANIWFAMLACTTLNGLIEKTLWRQSELWLMIGLLANVFAIVLLTQMVIAPLTAKAEAEEPKPEFCHDEYVRELIKAELAANKEEKAEEPVEPGLKEEAVRVIVHEELDKHVEELHTEYIDETEEAPAQEPVVEEKQPEPEPEPEPEPQPEPEPEPVVEEPKEEQKEEPVEEPVQEEPAAEEPASEEPAEEQPAEEAGEVDPFAALRGKRRVPFAEKFDEADPELKKKYEDLRDYIMSYGIKNRVSIPGDTFSAHRERYVFLTISGKHIKAYFALDPKDYENSTIPVETTNIAKYEDVKCTLKVRSDLSFRRACMLVDAVMAAKGVNKGDAPVEDDEEPEDEEA